MNKRLGAFLFFDKDGIVSDYIDYLLDKMSSHLDRLIIICNGDVTAEGKNILMKYSSELIFRENKGFDAGGWKELFLHHLTSEESANYDEIILFNDSFFGPIFPLEEMFNEMDNRKELDFWGITMHGKTKNIWGLGDADHFPAHIQSYFVVIRKRMFESEYFYKYWEKLPTANTIEEAVTFFEVTFTNEFESLGFKWSTYVNTEEYISDDLKNINTYLYYLDDLIIKKRCPFIKRKALYSGMSERLAKCDTSFTNTCITYIENNTSYPTDLIRKKIIRVADVREIYEAFHLDYILSEEYCVDEPAPHKIALVMHLYYPELFGYCRDYAMSVPEYADIYITTSRIDYLDDIKKMFEKVHCNKLEIIQVDGRGRDLGGLLVGARKHLMDYDYVCFIHDKMSLQDVLPGAGKSFCNILFDSMLCSSQYVLNIIKLFEDNQLLGILSPPMSYIGPYVDSYCLGWTHSNNIVNTKKLATDLGLNCNISEKFAPVTIGSTFWCRPEALKRIFEHEWTNESFDVDIGLDGSISHAIERIFGYVAQDAGYYTGAVLPTNLARITLSNISSMFRTLYKTSKEVSGRKRVWNLGILINALNRTKEKHKKMEKKIKKLNGKRAAVKHAVKTLIQ